MNVKIKPGNICIAIHMRDLAWPVNKYRLSLHSECVHHVNICIHIYTYSYIDMFSWARAVTQKKPCLKKKIRYVSIYLASIYVYISRYKPKI